MILLLSLIAGGTTLVIDPTRPPPTKTLKTVPSDIEVQIASAPSGMTLPITVQSAVWTDAAGKVVGCKPLASRAPALGPIACKQIEALPAFPVQYDENNRPIGAVRSITVSFNTAH
jgi:hypothetical protein